MHLRVFTAAAVLSGCGDLSESGSHVGDPTVPTDPVDPPDDTEVPAEFLEVSAGYFVAGFAYDAETQSITSAWYDGVELVPHITLILYTDEWIFDFADPNYCLVQFAMDDAVAAPWMSSEPDLAFGVVDNAASAGSTDCYEDAFHPSIDPAAWPDVVALLGTELGFGIGPRSERVEDTFADDDAEYLDAVGLVGGVLSLPDLFGGGPLYRDAFAFSYAVDEDFDIAMDGDDVMHIAAGDVLATPGELPSGYYDVTSLDTWVVDME